jgi:hypothetical protein
MGVELDPSEAATLERLTAAVLRKSVSPRSAPSKRELVIDHAAASAATTKILLRGGEVARARAFASVATVMAGLGFMTHVLFGALHVVDVKQPAVHALVAVTLGTFCGVCAISFFVSLIASLVLFPHALLVALEVVPDVGVFAAPGAPQPARFAMVALSFCVCLFSARQARTTQRAYGAAIEQSAALKPANIFLAARAGTVSAFAAAFDLAVQGRLDRATRGAADALVAHGAWKQAA